MKISKFEILTISLLFLITFIFLAKALSINWYNGMGDNATYADITQTIAKTGKTQSQVLSTTIDYIFNQKLVTITPAEIINLKLETHLYNQNIFRFHFTPIQYLFALLSKIFPLHILWESLTALFYLSLLFLTYFLLRTKQIPIVSALILIIFISLHPAWNISIFGQIYVDKVFLLTATILLFALSQKKQSLLLITVSSLISALIIEKTAIITGILLISYSRLFWNRKNTSSQFKIFLLGSIIGLYGFVIVRFFLDNSYYSSFLSLSSITGFADYLSTYPNAYQNLVTFLLINAPFLLLGFFEWRALLIAILMIIPNIFGNLGGAEKVGWVTHYHLIYFPFLVWAGVLGYINLQKKWLNKFGRLLLNIILISTTIIYGNVYNLKTFKLNQDSITKTVYSSWPMTTRTILRDSINPQGKYQQQKQLEKFIADNIPLNSKVSVPENLMIYLFQKNRVYYYPLGIDDADYAVLHVNKNVSPFTYYGIYTFIGSDNNTKIDNILFDRMVKLKYDFNQSLIYNDVAIIKRIK
ncbi:hypothetical protein HYV64_02915 [Candidatus Shapirobacteria bacterium]|nr:hypothetical protein [Candidatus Shapirobacteria bacterium]